MKYLDHDLCNSVRFVLLAIIAALGKPLTPQQARELAEVLEGQAKVVREAAGGDDATPDPR